MSVKALVMIGVGLALLYLFFTVGAPFMLALVVAIFMEPLTQLFIRTFRTNRLVAATISSTLFTIVLIGLMALLGVKVVAELIAFWDKVPQYVGEANTYVQQTISNLEVYFSRLSPEAAAQLESWISNFSTSITGMVTSISGSFVNFAKSIPGLFIFFIVFLVAIYLFSYSLNTMKATFLSLFDEKSRGQVDKVLQNLRKSIFGFLRAQFILSLMTYILSLIGLLILGIKYPLAIALLIIVVDILPILGTGSVLVPWATYLIFTGDPYTGIGLIVLFLVITVFRRVVEPKVLGDAVGISALAALISLYVGFKLVGVIGVFIGPLVVIIYIAARKAGLFQEKIKL
ncbi:sporulation integral membrane protein YtvI [Paenibacillus abyssi]|uniref:Sporulation integral membrane protein YtvI n=1 Tax=Paenibacillus abyssi TaxID=1340531 RepID=A0A917G7F0_9BACL|nr:sporulation integral membrane protein YtvI [Paenibacillus abyssi]GGG26621.1 sporulation integral membrane protein YtvI [Paenibacillus abyssi]